MPTSDSGTVTAGMIVAQKLRRNRKITITTSATVSSNVNCTSLTEARMVSVRSEMMLTLMADGIEACSTGSIALDPLHRLDDVGAGLALDRKDDRALVVVPARDQVVLRRARSPCRHRAPAPASRCDRRGSGQL